MAHRFGSQRWLGVVADASGATLYAAAGAPPNAILLALDQIDYELESLSVRKVPCGRCGPVAVRLRHFVVEHNLLGCPAYVRVTGGGTVVHKLHLPRLRAGQRAAAARTHLTTYAGGRPLCMDLRIEQVLAEDGTADVLAAGVDADLAAGLCRVLGAAGVRVDEMTALAAACRAPIAHGPALQVVLGERTSLMQLFRDGRLAFCRDVLLGRRDFVAAYQRPILTDHGPITLTSQQAEELVRRVGVPIGEHTASLDGAQAWLGLRTAIEARHLWPLISPVLGRLAQEAHQTLAHQVTTAKSGDGSGDASYPQAGLNVLSLPPVPNLADYLVAELDLQGPLIGPTQVEGEYLRAFVPSRNTKIDLFPPHQRLVRKTRRPALAAGLCALVVIACNLKAPQAAETQIKHLRPSAQLVEGHLKKLEAELAAAGADYQAALTDLQRQSRLSAALRPSVPTIRLCRALLETVPQQVTLTRVSLDADRSPPTADVVAVYQNQPEADGGRQAAGTVAAEWARRMAGTPGFADAEVVSVSSQAGGARAQIALRATIAPTASPDAVSVKRRKRENLSGTDHCSRSHLAVRNPQ